MICITYLLSYGVVPTVTAAMIEVHWDSDYTESTVRPVVLLVSLGLLVSISAIPSAIAAFVILHRQKSGLYSSSHASPAGLGSLIAQSNLLQKFQAIPSFETQDGIDKALGALRLGLSHTCTSQRISFLNPDQAVQESIKTLWQRDFSEAHPWWLRGRTYVRLNIILLVPIIVYITVLHQQAYAAIMQDDVTIIDGRSCYQDLHRHSSTR